MLGYETSVGERIILSRCQWSQDLLGQSAGTACGKGGWN